MPAQTYTHPGDAERGVTIWTENTGSYCLRPGESQHFTEAELHQSPKNHRVRALLGIPEPVPPEPEPDEEDADDAEDPAEAEESDTSEE